MTASDRTDEPHSEPADGPGAGRRLGYLIAAFVLAVGLAFAGGLLAGQFVGDRPPAADSVDAGFAQDMQIHHAQAVEMSMIVRDRTDDEDVRLLAYDIAIGQQHQVGQMHAWLDLWDLPQRSSTPMAWMQPEDQQSGHGDQHGDQHGNPHDDHHGSGDDGRLMPGMATAEELQQLRDVRGRSAEILFLQLMIKHHRAGVEMAQYAAQYGTAAHVRDLAEKMVSGQQSEVDAMNEMLRERGADPI